MFNQAGQLKVMNRAIIVLLFLAWLGLGCRSEKPHEAQSGTTTPADGRSKIKPVQLIDSTGLRKLVQERNGRILFLNIWATWCAPCVEEFPEIVKLSRTEAENEVDVVAISADYTDEIESKIVPFLKRHNTPFQVYVAKFDHQEDFINAVHPTWSGALPATLIYNQRGVQRFFKVGQVHLKSSRKRSTS